MTVAFWIAAAVAMAATAMVVTRTKIMHALLYLVVSFLALALVFYTLGAPFVAALEVIIYAGAIMVLFLFAVMLLGLGPTEEAEERGWLRPRSWILPGALAALLFFELIYLLASGSITGGGSAPADASAQVKAVGIALFGPYLLGVELASVILLAGLVAAHRLTATGSDSPAPAGPGEGRPGLEEEGGR